MSIPLLYAHHCEIQLASRISFSNQSVLPWH